MLTAFLFTGYRYSPSFISLPTVSKLVINEKIPPNQFLFTVTFYDLDVDTLTPTFTISNGDWTYFTIKDNSAFRLLIIFFTYHFVISVLFGLPSSFLFICSIADVYTSNTQIDYESLSRTSYLITASVSDGTSTVSKSFTIKIDNVNEAPSFQTTVYTITADEGPVSFVSFHL